MIARPGNIKDADKIAENNVLLARESEKEVISYKTTRLGVESVLNDPEKGFYIIAEENNEIIGQLMITFEWSDWRNTNIWWLQSVYVNKSHRKKGVFKRLIEETKQLAIEKDIHILRLYVHIDNKKAIKAYKNIDMKKKPYDIFEYFINE